MATGEVIIIGEVMAIGEAEVKSWASATSEVGPVLTGPLFSRKMISTVFELLTIWIYGRVNY